MQSYIYLLYLSTIFFKWKLKNLVSIKYICIHLIKLNQMEAS